MTDASVIALNQRNLTSIPPLSPSQQQAFDEVRGALATSGVSLVNGLLGTGKSLVLRHLQANLGGRILTVGNGLHAIAACEAGGFEEALFSLVTQALEAEDILYLDDFTSFDQIGDYCADRPYYLEMLLPKLYDHVSLLGKHLVLSSALYQSNINRARASTTEITGFDARDYQAIITHHLGAEFPLDEAVKVARSYKRLSGYQLEAVSRILRAEGNSMIDAEGFLTTLDEHVKLGNVNLEEVEKVSLDTLVGVDDIVRHLRRTILLPMTQPQLADSLGLKTKRGVLLYGEPGTGKTTIGRALAQQMKGKFFMIDGSFIPETAAFAGKVQAVMTAAEMCSPAVIFIDDADVIFRNEKQAGFVRKLLTKLDGLESESQAHICIIMTAMKVSDMPPALLRSGRVEVWLEMKLPGTSERAQIVQHFAQSLPADLRAFDEDRVAEATEGFTPADLRGLVGDARGHIAFDRYRDRQQRTFEDYLVIAASEIQQRKVVLRSLGG